MKSTSALWLLCAMLACGASPWDNPAQYSAERGTVSDGVMRAAEPGKSADLRSPNWTLPGDKAQQLAVSLELRCEDVKRGSILLQGFDAKGKMTLWRNLLNFKGGMDWTKQNFAVIVPAGIRNARLVVRLEPGGGSVGVRAIHGEASDPATAVLPGTELIANGWLGTADGKMPQRWKQKFWPANESVFEIRPGRNGVDLVYKDGGSRFGVEPELFLPELPAGTVLRISGRYRVSGKGKACIMAEFFDASGKAVGEVLSAPGLAGSWQELTLDTEVPAGSVTTRIYFLNTGWDTVTFLSAKCEAIEQSAKQKAYPLSVFASPVEGNKIIFGGKHLFHTIADSPNPLSFDFWGNPGALRNPALMLELPPGLRIAGAFSSHPAVYQAETPEQSVVERDGRKWTRYAFRNPAAFRLVAPRVMWARQLVLAFEPEKGETGDFPVSFYLADENGRSSETQMTVRVLPPLEKLANPKHFRILEWDELDISFPQEPLFRNVISKYEEAGLISRMRHRNETQRKQDEFLAARNWVMHLSLQDYTQKRIVGSVVDQLADRRYAIEHDGRVSNHNICPEYYVDSPLFRTELKRMLGAELTGAGARAGDWAFMDYEPWAAMDSCFCPVCLGKFSKWIKTDKALSAADIRRDHAPQWAAYRSDQTARINRLTSELLQELMPGIRVVDYDYPVAFHEPGFEKMFQSVCKDPRLYEDCVEAHFSSFYSKLGKRGFELIDSNVKALKKPIFMTPLISRNDMMQGRYTTDEQTLSPRRFRQMLLSAASAGAAGLCIYPGYQIDGAFFPEINRGMHEVAVLEEIFRNGTRVEDVWGVKTLPNRIVPLADGVSELPNWGEFAGCRAHRLDGKVLLSVFNFNPRETLYFSPSGEFSGDVAICDPVRRVRFRDGGRQAFDAAALRKLVFAVGAEEVRFLSIMPVADVPADWATEEIGNTRLEHEKLLKQSAGRSFAPVTVGKVRASVTDADRDGRPDLLFEMPGRKLVLTFGGAAIQQWRSGGKAFCVESSDPSQGGLLWDYLAEPHMKYVSSSPLYELTRLAGEGEAIRAEFRYPVPGKALLLEKTVRVDLARDKVSAAYRIVNTGDSAQTVSLWSHNIPQKGFAEIRLGDMVLSKSPIEQLWLCGSASPVGLKLAATGRSDADAATIVGTAPLRLTIPGGMLNQFYFWRESLTTMEAMSRPVTVAPGKACELTVTLSAD